MTNRPSPELASAYRYELDQATSLWRGLTLADLAHVLELFDLELLPKQEAATLLAALLDLADQDPRQAGLRPDRGDVFTNREWTLQKAVGNSAGWLCLGRTRREALRVALRLELARFLREALDASALMQAALLGLAERHVTTVMPDYTYLQVAEPTTFGH